MILMFIKHNPHPSDLALLSVPQISVGYATQNFGQEIAEFHITPVAYPTARKSVQEG